MFLRLSLLLLMLLTAPAGAAPAPQAVDIPLSSGVLHAQLYKPDGEGPFPTVIALHGCAGLGDATAPVWPRYRDWALDLVRSNHAVLLPDSYGSHEFGPQCRATPARSKVRRARVADIAAARDWLVRQSWVRPDRISLIGWANGASALLWAVRPQSATREAGPDFRAAIAFYPDCRTSAGLGWSARVPTLVLIGANDDVASPPACRQMVQNAQGRSALARIVVYPGAFHGFDRADTPLRALTDGNDATVPAHGHLGGNAEARAAAQKAVAEWLAR